MTRLKNLYTYLITNRRSHVDGWLTEYRSFTGDVARVREALKKGSHLGDVVTYAGTTFADKPAPRTEFLKRLLSEKNNGVSSRGQSVLSNVNIERFISNDIFCAALEKLIASPIRENFTSFSAAWETMRKQVGAYDNRLLINRTVAACTLDVTSTVNGSNFESVYSWLVKEGLIPALADRSADWFDKNVHLMNCLRKEFQVELAKNETSGHLLSIFVWNLYENIANPFSLKKQVVKYGAPGTGKTYSAKISTKLLFDIWLEEFGAGCSFTHKSNCETVQFHPSFGYEDFMEGLRPKLDGAGKAQLVLQNGIFKRFCMTAGEWEKDVHAIPVTGEALAKNWQELKIEELKPHAAHLNGERWRHILSQRDESKKVADAVPPFFFIIDEINRAELSRVLGELMLCLEYRGIEGAVSTQYAALNTAETGMIEVGGGFKFFIPHNVYVIGTMNTIDRSVESFDLALRRRFRWERIDPDIVALRYQLKVRDSQQGDKSRPWAGLADDLEALNEHIRKNDILGEDYQIGHAYLMNLRYPADLNRSQVREQVWEDSIRPLLEEYLRGSGRSETLIPELSKSFGLT